MSHKTNELGAFAEEGAGKIATLTTEVQEAKNNLFCSSRAKFHMLFLRVSEVFLTPFEIPV